MPPMFLRDLEELPGPGPHAEVIKTIRTAGGTVPQIFYLFAFKPEATNHLAQFTQAVMRGPSPLPPGMRELIAAFTSNENHCPF